MSQATKVVPYVLNGPDSPRGESIIRFSKIGATRHSFKNIWYNCEISIWRAGNFSSASWTCRASTICLVRVTSVGLDWLCLGWLIPWGVLIVGATWLFFPRDPSYLFSTYDLSLVCPIGARASITSTPQVGSLVEVLMRRSISWCTRWRSLSCWFFKCLILAFNLTSVSYSLEAIQHSTSSDFPHRIIPWSIRLWTSLLNLSQSPNKCPHAPKWYLQVSPVLPCSFNSFGRMYPRSTRATKRLSRYPSKSSGSGRSSSSLIIAFTFSP